MITNDSKLNTENSLESFNLKKAISTYVKQWKWFLLSIIICLGTGYINLRYTTPQYAVSAKIKLLDKNEASSAGDALGDLAIFSEKEDAKVEDEIEVIQSRIFLRNIVKKLNLNLSYFTKGRVYESELYKTSPIAVNFIVSDSIINRTNYNFYVDILSSTEFNYRKYEDDIPKKIGFGENISASFGDFVIVPSSLDIENWIDRTIRVKITPIDLLSESLKYRINIFPVEKSSKVLIISMQDPIINKAKDIINTLVEEYNLSMSKEKNDHSKGVTDFIDRRIELIARDLVSVDSSIVHFKTGNKVTDVTSEAGQFLSSSSANEQQLDISRTRLRQLDYAKESVNDTNSYDPIPSNLGMNDPAISTLSVRYNQLLEQRRNLLKSAGSKNPIVVQLDVTINALRENLRQSIDNSINANAIQIRSLESQSRRINSKIFSVPGQQSKLRSIERKQGTKESLYLYLLEKREESAISSTTTNSPSAKILDEAYNSNGGPVSPNNRMVYIAAMFIGLFIPFSIIYVSDLLDTRIHNKEDLENIIKNITVLGEIPKVKGKQTDLLVQRNDRSILSESFRIIRTNFDYVRRGREAGDYNNVIFVTSTINGEGKSFFSMNMALTLANTDKRVLLIGGDIRNPQIFSGIVNKQKNDASKIGLTEYLVDKSILVGEAINTFDINDNKIDVLLSGKVPPNPAELLMTDRMKTLFDKVSAQYDYVIVDTAPSMLVTDTLLFSQYAGHTFYMTRAGYTEKRILNFAKELHADKKLNGMMLVVNDVKQSNFGYGAKYGYYGAKEKKSIFKRKD